MASFWNLDPRLHDYIFLNSVRRYILKYAQSQRTKKKNNNYYKVSPLLNLSKMLSKYTALKVNTKTSHSNPIEKRLDQFPKKLYFHMDKIYSDKLFLT